MNKRIVILGGGTVFHVRPHLALSAPAYGGTARALYDLCEKRMPYLDRDLVLTRMAAGHSAAPETNEDIARLVDEIVADHSVKAVFMSCALCDFTGWIPNGEEAGKYGTRLQSRDTKGLRDRVIKLTPADKIIGRIRRERKDIFLVGFKTTCGATEDEQYIAGLGLLKGASCNLVLANDVKTRTNMIITPEEARYHVTHNRQEALEQLVDMTYHRTHLTFTRSTVVDGNPVPWDDERVPASLRAVVDHCIQQGAYKPFRGATVGHFAVKVNDTTFLTSKRKTNFNDLAQNGLVEVKTDGPDSVIAYGHKPSVGGQSQRIIFKEHEGMDCIVHFHCPLRENAPDDVPVMSQREFECGSHECGQNTSNGLKSFGSFKAVMLDNHGPNIVFNRNADPTEIVRFIDRNFDLAGKTGGYVTLGTE